MYTPVTPYTQVYCPSCSGYHGLGWQKAIPHAKRLMQRMAHRETIQLFETVSHDLDLLQTDWLFGDARGKMFGVLVGQTDQGKECVCYAFSGQYRGLWSVPGWVDPVFDTAAFERMTRETEREIKTLTRQLAKLDPADKLFRQIKQHRKHLSKTLMKEIHSLYELRNFRGQCRPLMDVFSSGGIPPTGTGDCCAPKLIHHAVLNNIKPKGMVEFYWGRSNRSETRQHGCFYPPCQEKCMPILGFLFCGMEEKTEKNIYA
ncbi:hypothetical protein [Desulfogranum japonicum]|uniref:hypothetical protein n=1 Tax=Desulfogranum japonicum TaxID=231447 RepID=UPI0003FB700F|nr:hypothetical protein [Desulfogranum japonicum]